MALAKGPTSLGLGVFDSFDGKVGRVELRDVPALRRTVGERLFAALIAAFNASERMLVMADLALGTKGMDPRAVRNRQHIIALYVAALHEGMAAIEAMKAAGTKRVLAGSEAWSRLDEIHKRYTKDARLKEIRHVFGHHLGIKEITEGIGKIPEGESVIAILVYGRRVLDRAYPVALRALLAGTALKPEGLVEFAKNAVLDSKLYSQCVESLFLELLKHHGVRIPLPDG